MCPPILQRRWICCFHYDAVRDVVAFVRPLVGAEHMFLLGVNNFDRCGISDFRLRELAGSSMSCGYLSVLLSLLFGTVDFQTPLPALHAKLDGDPVHRSLPLDDLRLRLGTQIEMPYGVSASPVDSLRRKWGNMKKLIISKYKKRQR